MLRKFTVKWRNHINDILSFWAVNGNERSGGVWRGGCKGYSFTI